MIAPPTSRGRAATRAVALAVTTVAAAAGGLACDEQLAFTLAHDLEICEANIPTACGVSALPVAGTTRPMMMKAKMVSSFSEVE